EPVVGKVPLQYGADRLFSAPVGLGHRRAVGLELDREVGAVQRGDDGIGGACGLHGGGELRRGAGGQRLHGAMIESAAPWATVSARSSPAPAMPAPPASATAVAWPGTAPASRPSARWMS